MQDNRPVRIGSTPLEALLLALAAIPGVEPPPPSDADPEAFRAWARGIPPGEARAAISKSIPLDPIPDAVLPDLSELQAAARSLAAPFGPQNRSQKRRTPGAGVSHAPGKKERRKRERQARKAARKAGRR
jgi:hypothetical protein